MYLKKKGAAAKILFIEYAYDANGNTTHRTIRKETGNEVVTFEYDTLNRVTKSTEGSKWTSYRYDNAGNRFIKEGSDGSVSLYLRHGQIAVAMDIELAKTSETAFKGKLNRYVLSGDLLAGRVTKTAAMDDQITVTKSWYHLDHLNSTKCVTDASGVVEVTYTYRAFGEQLKRLDAAGQDTVDKAKYSYGGKELDEDTNLYYFNARYYDATIGRFISVDPIQDGSNWYIYCINNPLSFKDPTGLESGTVNPQKSTPTAEDEIRNELQLAPDLTKPVINGLNRIKDRFDWDKLSKNTSIIQAFGYLDDLASMGALKGIPGAGLALAPIYGLVSAISKITTGKSQGEHKISFTLKNVPTVIKTQIILLKITQLSNDVTQYVANITLGPLAGQKPEQFKKTEEISANYFRGKVIDIGNDIASLPEKSIEYLKDVWSSTQKKLEEFNGSYIKEDKAPQGK